MIFHRFFHRLWRSETVQTIVNMMDENVTFNFNVSNDESEDYDVLANAMSYTMYKIGMYLIYT